MDFPTNLQAEADVGEDSQLENSEMEQRSPMGEVDCGLLIEAIQSYPYLYDLGHTLYKDAKRKSVAWEHIGELLNCTVEDCQKAWRNLRDRFVREKKRLASGAGAPEATWPFYHPMVFYGNFHKPRKTYTSTKKPEGRVSAGSSRPSSSASTWSNVTYDAIMSPEGMIVAELGASEGDNDAPGPSRRVNSEMPGGRKEEGTPQTPTTSSERQPSKGHFKKRKRPGQEDDEENTIIGVTKTLLSKLDSVANKTANSTFCEYLCQELEKLPQSEAKKKRRKMLTVLFEDSD